MRHQKRGKKFHRKKGQRQALFKSLMNNLTMREKIETTEAKAKMLRSKLEKLITMGKKQNLAALRILMARLPEKAALKIYHEIAPRYVGRRGGYLRVIKSGRTRKNDGSKTAIVEFV